MATLYMSGLTGEDDDNIRQFVPPWSRYSDIMYFGHNEDGQLRWVDLSYTDPYAYLRTPIRAFLRGDNWKEKIVESGWEAAEPFLGEEILAGKIADTFRNKTNTGGRVYNPADDYEDIAMDVAGHIAGTLEPGTISSLRRVYKGLTGDVESHGKSYDPGVELGSMLSGFRVNTIDISQALSFKARDYSKGKRNAARMLTSAFSNRGELSSRELREAFRSAVKAHRDKFTDIHDSVKAANALGLTEQEIARVLDSSGLSRKDVDDTFEGRFVPYMPGDRFFDSVMDSALSEANSEAEYDRIRRRYDKRLQELMELYRQEGQREMIE